MNIVIFYFRTLLFWGVKKKKPMSKVLLAHGSDSETENPNWIVSLCALQNTDLIASGNFKFLLFFF